MNTANTTSNIILIGMPGSGKSTVGVVLAKRMAMDFVDTDVLIQIQAGKPLQRMVDEDGYLALRRVEEVVLLSLNRRRHVIATGGSAVYSERAMAHLKAGGVCVFLDVDIPTLQARVPDFSTRGLAKPPEQSFADLYAERRRLYLRYADVVVPCGNLGQEDVAAQIADQVDRSSR